MNIPSLKHYVISMVSSLLDKLWSSVRLEHSYSIYCYHGYIVCVQTRKSAAWLAGKMHQEGHAVALVTGESTIDQRIAVLNRYIWTSILLVY